MTPSLILNPLLLYSIDKNGLAVDINCIVKTYGSGKKKVTALYETTMKVPRGCM
jgi:hypothetical protein